jgi:hypothetical protein
MGELRRPPGTRKGISGLHRAAVRRTRSEPPGAGGEDREAEELGGCAPGLRGALSAVPFITMSHFFVAEENLGEIHRGISEWSITFPATSWRFEAEWIEHYLTQPA